MKKSIFILLVLSFVSKASKAALVLDMVTTNASVDTGSTAWMMTSTALVLLMVPGLAMFYGGLVRTKNVLGTMMHSFVAMGVITLVWVTIGYSMSFGSNILGGWFGWNSDYFMLNGIDNSILKGGIPEYIFAMFQAKFAIIAPALIAGAFAERIAFKPYILFIVLWSITVYNPLCHWVWASDGFLYNMGVKGAIDFAGGTVVHISAGVSGLVAAIFLGPRRRFPNISSRPSNLVMTIMGAGLLWVGWFGFNAGSSIASDLESARALTVTQIAAAAGSITWILLENLYYGKPTVLGFVSGILAGLVAITPAAGVVKPYGAIALGILAASGSYLYISKKHFTKIDDTLDVFGIHGIAAIIGALALSFFIRDSWMNSASALNGGTWTAIQQFGVQAIAVGVAILYSASLTLIILWGINKFFKLRVSAENEMIGLDRAFHGERGYGMLNPN